MRRSHGERLVRAVIGIPIVTRAGVARDMGLERRADSIGQWQAQAWRDAQPDGNAVRWHGRNIVAKDLDIRFLCHAGG